MKTTVQILEEARELLSDESRWTQGVIARKANGRPTILEDNEAVCFCSLGAIGKQSDRYSSLEVQAVRTLQKAVGTGVSCFNDAPERKHSEVLEAFDKAIELAKAQECS